MPRVVVAGRTSASKEWEICYICLEADHAPYVAQEIKNQEGDKYQVGYCDEDDFYNGKHAKIKQVKKGGTLPPPASSLKKFKDEPLDVPKGKVYQKPVEQPKPEPPKPAEVVQKPVVVKEEKPPAKPKSELGMFRRDRK